MAGQEGPSARFRVVLLGVRPLSVTILLLALISGAAFGQVVRQITQMPAGRPGIGVMDDAGTVVFTNSATNQFGGNPALRIQIVRFDPSTGAGSLVTSFPSGVSELGEALSVSDDGQWLAFISSGNLTGSNHDESPELFVIKQDGTSLAQLSNDPAPNAGSVKTVAMAGTQTSPSAKIAFVSDSNPLGSNPDHSDEVFLVSRDGTGLSQVTNQASGDITSIGISDDGTRIVFASDGNPTGGNADGNYEVFTVASNGTGLLQISSATAGKVTWVSIAGGGSRIAFSSTENLTGGNADLGEEVFSAAWGSTSKIQLTNSTGPFGALAVSGWPTLTDDGVWAYFWSNQGTLTVNTDRNYEVWKIHADGSGGLAAVTNTSASYGTIPYYPVIVSGSGNRLAYIALLNLSGGNPDGTTELYTVAATGGTIRQLTSISGSVPSDPTISPDGSLIVFSSTINPFGTNNDGQEELFRIQPDGTGLAQITNSPSGGDANLPSVAADNTTIVFDSANNPFGTNPDFTGEIFRIQANGTGLAQLTSGSNESYGARISRGGTVVVFNSYADLVAGGNTDGGLDVFKIDSNGSNLVQLSHSPAGKYGYEGRVDSSGTWVAFESNANLDGSNPDGSAEIYRVRTNGTGLQAISASPVASSTSPDISGDGQRIVYVSNGNPVGTNPDGSTEVFLYDTASAVTTQLTDQPAKVVCQFPVITEDGAFVDFFSNGEFTEDDPDYHVDLFRVRVATGVIERIGARHDTAPLLDSGYGEYAHAMSVGGSGSRAVLVDYGDLTDENPDHQPELWVIDRTVQPTIDISRTSPTRLSWRYEAGPIRYDVIRGSVANLAPGAGGTVNLGPVVCLENDSPNSTTDGFLDAGLPAPGGAFFFLYRGSQGTVAGPGSYGQGTGAAERHPASGDCAP